MTKAINYKGLDGVDGFKSGTMSFAGFCFSITCHRDGHYLLSVVAGSTSNANRYADSVKLLNYGFARRAELDHGADETVSREPVVSPESATDTSPWALEWMKRGDELGLHTYRALSRKDYCGQEHITRGELAALLVGGLHPEKGYCVSAFTDVPAEHPFAGENNEAVAAGMVQGDGKGHFRPDDLVSRQEMALMLTRLYRWEKRTPKNNFADCDTVRYEFSEAVGRMSESRLMQGDDDGNFCPQAPMTREMAVKTVITCYDRQQTGTLILRSIDEQPFGCER